jgi:hypothetical protein
MKLKKQTAKRRCPNLLVLSFDVCALRKEETADFLAAVDDRLM